jgi:hypothetical protein
LRKKRVFLQEESDATNVDRPVSSEGSFFFFLLPENVKIKSGKAMMLPVACYFVWGGHEN